MSTLIRWTELSLEARDKMARIVMCLFLAAGAIASATWFAASTDALQTTPAPPPRKLAADFEIAKAAGHFRGRVAGPDGKPLRGARVYAAAQADGLERTLAVRARTDADGRFAFDASDMTSTEIDGLPVRRDWIVVSATADGYGADWIGSWGPDRFKQDDLALQLARDDVPIRGRFLGPDGQPIGGARVQLTGLSVPRGRDLDAHLERERKDSILTSSEYEKGIALPSLSSLIPVATETRTDADGRFTLSGLGRDRIAALTVSAPSVVDTSLTVMTRNAPDVHIRLGDELPNLNSQVIHGTGFTLPLKRGRTISGVVRDRYSRLPIAGMWVGLGSQNTLPTRTRDENYPRDGVIFNRTVTDAKGRFTIPGLDPSIAKRTITAASAPGMAYLSAAVFVEGDAPALIECQRGIPFRLKLLDEQGRPADVAAKVTSHDVSPNPHAPRGSCAPCGTPLSRAAREADGTYHGFVVPGPGAILVETPGCREYRPAYVDPKAFFAPGQTNWSAQEWISTYGTKDTLVTSTGLHYQDAYAAIVLINPAPGSGPLELSATVVKAKPRLVSLVDPDGKPVVGVQTMGMQSYPYPPAPPLRAASFF